MAPFFEYNFAEAPFLVPTFVQREENIDSSYWSPNLRTMKLTWGGACPVSFSLFLSAAARHAARRRGHE